MNKFQRYALMACLVVCGAPAFAAVDYSSITDAVSATGIVAGIGVIAGVMFLPRVARWGFRQIMALIK